MANGYTGKILRVNLTTKEIGALDTAKYEEFGGGYGMGTAIFWDLAAAPGEWDLKDAYDPRNVLPLMAGPLAATGVPGAGRTSVCGLSPETFPTCEFWRGNFGGRFGTTLKLAGWDGVVVEGKADKPVWINIINDRSRSRTPKSFGAWIPGRRRTELRQWWAEKPVLAKNGNRSGTPILPPARRLSALVR